MRTKRPACTRPPARWSAGRGARLRLEEVVVDDVERRDAEREPRQTRSVREGCPTRAAAPSGLGDGWAALVMPTLAERAAPSTGSPSSPCSKCGSHSSHFGRYQFQSPSSFIDAGRSTARTMVASIRIAAAKPTPNCLKISIESIAKIEKTQTITIAALVITPPSS